jgi:hypothetical protein
MLLAEHRTADMLADAEMRRRVRAAVADRRASRRAARQLPRSPLGPPAERITQPTPMARVVRTGNGRDSDSDDRESQLCHAASR